MYCVLTDRKVYWRKENKKKPGRKSFINFKDIFEIAKVCLLAFLPSCLLAFLPSCPLWVMLVANQFLSSRSPFRHSGQGCTTEVFRKKKKKDLASTAVPSCSPTPGMPVGVFLTLPPNTHPPFICLPRLPSPFS